MTGGELLQSKNVDVINGMLEEAIRATLDKHAPVKTIQVRTKHRSWVGPDLVDKMKTRDGLREAARSSMEDQDWGRYRQIRNEVTKDIRKSKEEHYRDPFKKLKDTNDSKKNLQNHQRTSWLESELHSNQFSSRW